MDFRFTSQQMVEIAEDLHVMSKDNEETKHMIMGAIDKSQDYGSIANQMFILREYLKPLSSEDRNLVLREFHKRSRY